jgi:hypothetical protein
MTVQERKANRAAAGRQQLPPKRLASCRKAARPGERVVLDDEMVWCFEK